MARRHFSSQALVLIVISIAINMICLLYTSRCV
ncbi:hypothetical protein AZZ66_003833 [Escherichia coli]|nr:hypothetical protein AZZ66_003833 [Escherichia coli]